MVTFSFNATNIEPAGEFALIKDGYYPAIIISSELKENKEKRSIYLRLQLQITRGTYKGRQLFANITIQNQNEIAVQMGNGQMSAICHAISVISFNDTAKLHNKELVIKVGSEKKEGYNEINRVKAYFPISTLAELEEKQKQRDGLTSGIPSMPASEPSTDNDMPDDTIPF